MSEHLSNCGVPHLVLERHRIAERWRSERWDSLVANGPAWHDRFPGMEFPDADPDAFVPQGDGRGLFRRLREADRRAHPLRRGGQGSAEERRPARLPRRNVGGRDRGQQRRGRHRTFPAPRHSRPRSRDTAGVMQIHSNAYRNPGQLPEGAVLVVGAGSSGVQIAEELLRAGRRVYLSVGPHDRPPRAYRGRDFCWWLGVLGKWDAEARKPGKGHVTIAVSGAHGGHTIDFRRLAAQGMTLVGRTESYKNGVDDICAGSCRQHRAAVTRTTCRCWMKPTPMLPAMASTFRRSPRPARSSRTRGLRDRSHSRRSIWPRPG